MLARPSLALILALVLGPGCEPGPRPTPPAAAAPARQGPLGTGRVVTGRVVAVADGDTLTVLDASQRQHKIRFLGIDAPEKAMPYGQRAKQSLAALAFGREVQVEVRSMDRYQREVGRILLAGRDLNLAMVESGMAWVYRQYTRELSGTEARAYLSAEAEAKAAGRGLWQDPRPTPPWEWRKARRAKL